MGGEAKIKESNSASAASSISTGTCYVPGSGKRLKEEKQDCLCHYAEVAPK